MQKTLPKSNIFHGFCDLLKIWWKMGFLNVYEKVCVRWALKLYITQLPNFITKRSQNPRKIVNLDPILLHVIQKMPPLDSPSFFSASWLNESRKVIRWCNFNAECSAVCKSRPWCMVNHRTAGELICFYQCLRFEVLENKYFEKIKHISDRPSLFRRAM